MYFSEQCSVWWTYRIISVVNNLKVKNTHPKRFLAWIFFTTTGSYFVHVFCLSVVAHAGWGLIFRWNPRRLAREKENSHQPGFARAKPEMETQRKHFDLFAISRFVSSFQRTNHIYSPVIPPLFRRYAAAKIARAERRQSEGRAKAEPHLSEEWRVKSEETLVRRPKGKPI